MSNPAFSVIVPAYNAARTIGATLASVRAQSCRNFELLVIDDGSTDATIAAAHAAIGDDTRARVVSKPNGGVSAARNLGAELARGRWLAFLDADDLWAVDKLAAHASFHLDRHALSASYARVAFIDAKAATLDARTQSTVHPGELTIAALLAENPVCTASNLVVVRDAFRATGGFDAKMRHAEDQEWQLRAAAAGHAIAGFDDLLVGYRNSEDGLSADLRAMHEGWQRLAAVYGGEGVPQARAVFCRYLARRALRGGAPGAAALSFAWTGMRASPPSFFAPPRRGALTLAGALASPFLPAALRARLFA